MSYLPSSLSPLILSPTPHASSPSSSSLFSVFPGPISRNSCPHHLVFISSPQPWVPISPRDPDLSISAQSLWICPHLPHLRLPSFWGPSPRFLFLPPQSPCAYDPKYPISLSPFQFLTPSSWFSFLQAQVSLTIPPHHTGSNLLLGSCGPRKEGNKEIGWGSLDSNWRDEGD